MNMNMMNMNPMHYQNNPYAVAYQAPASVLVPTVIQKTATGERAFDIYSRLLQDRIIMLTGPIDDAVSDTIVAQLLFLASEDPVKDIQLYINSPGGSITAGNAIADTMHYIKPDVSTICTGMCASMGAFLLAAGEKGKRYSLPRGEVMIHQPLGGAQGQATEMEISTNRILKMKHSINEQLAGWTGQTVEKLAADTERDNFMSSEEALAYGLIDKIIEKQS